MRARVALTIAVLAAPLSACGLSEGAQWAINAGTQIAPSIIGAAVDDPAPSEPTVAGLPTAAPEEPARGTAQTSGHPETP